MFANANPYLTPIKSSRIIAGPDEAIWNECIRRSDLSKLQFGTTPDRLAVLEIPSLVVVEFKVVEADNWKCRYRLAITSTSPFGQDMPEAFNFEALSFYLRKDNTRGLLHYFGRYNPQSGLGIIYPPTK